MISLLTNDLQCSITLCECCRMIPFLKEQMQIIESSIICRWGIQALHWKSWSPSYEVLQWLDISHHNYEMNRYSPHHHQHLGYSDQHGIQSTGRIIQKYRTNEDSIGLQLVRIHQEDPVHMITECPMSPALTESTEWRTENHNTEINAAVKSSVYAHHQNVARKVWNVVMVTRHIPITIHFV